MKYGFWDSEENRLISWNELQDEKYVVRAAEDGFYLLDISRTDDDGYDFEISGEWRKVEH
jgi:hypothetical protein